MVRHADDLAKRLFGRPLRIELAAWIHRSRESPFYLLEAQEAMAALGHAASSTRAELGLFVSCRMLVEHAEQKRRYFTPVDSPLWGAFQAITDALKEVPELG